MSADIGVTRRVFVAKRIHWPYCSLEQVVKKRDRLSQNHLRVVKSSQSGISLWIKPLQLQNEGFTLRMDVETTFITIYIMRKYSNDNSFQLLLKTHSPFRQKPTSMASGAPWSLPCSARKGNQPRRVKSNKHRTPACLELKKPREDYEKTWKTPGSWSCILEMMNWFGFLACVDPTVTEATKL